MKKKEEKKEKEKKKKIGIRVRKDVYAENARGSPNHQLDIMVLKNTGTILPARSTFKDINTILKSVITNFEWSFYKCYS